MNDTNSTQNIRSGISDKETYLLCALANEGKSIINLEDISRISGASYNYAKVIADRLRKKMWLIQINRGMYLISPLSAGVESEFTEHAFVIAASLAKGRPYYVAYWTALNHYGYTEQMPFTTLVATTARIPKTKVHGVPYEFLTIDKKKFFGTRNLFLGGDKIQISDENKTIADALDHPEQCGGVDEVAKGLWHARNDVDFEKIVDYAERMNNSAIIKRLGYLADVLEVEIPKGAYSRMRASMKSGCSWLDPHSVKKQKKFSSKWNLFINRSRSEIREVHAHT